MDFIALDVETANEAIESICCIGLAQFRNGQHTDTWYQLINPEDEFSGINISIHGIEPSMVKGFPTFPNIVSELFNRIEGQLIVHHTHFDRTSINRACSRYHIQEPNIEWLDTARIARRTWKECAFRGYGLANIASTLHIKFQHHNAGEDARVAGLIFLEACKKTGLNLESWRQRLKKPIEIATEPEADPEGIFYGEEIVFTGQLSSNRITAKRLAAQAGCEIGKSVKKTTTILVVGEQDIRKLQGHEKSLKQRKAEKLIKKGHHIRIISENDFKFMVEKAYIRS